MTHDNMIFKCMVDKQEEISEAAKVFAPGLALGMTFETIQAYINNIRDTCSDIDEKQQEELQKIFSEIPFVAVYLFHLFVFFVLQVR